MREYIALTKPRITWLILMSTGVGYFFGMKRGWNGLHDWILLLHTLIGTGLLASGTAALNQWYEREADCLMRRPAGRPLPTGKMTANSAMWFGIGRAVVGFVELAVWVNLLTGVLGALTLGAYLFIYTPLKQRSHLSTVIGALPGAVPPLMGYAASNGALTAEAWTLFAILAFWQIPHFMAIAWLYRDEYAKAGFVMLPNVDADGSRTAQYAVANTVALFAASLCPFVLHMNGAIYLTAAICLGAAYFWCAVRFAGQLTAQRARQLFFASIIYLPLLLVAMVCDKLK